METGINIGGARLSFYPIDHKMTVREEEFEIVKVEELQNQGINMSDIVKLQAAGICSVSVSKMVKRRRLTCAHNTFSIERFVNNKKKSFKD